tara:strand:- start:1636 stop:2379 length:744 start_codon:yes stop_codon:yes gene_type:complete
MIMNLDKILPKPLPEHIAIIMDGNGRWARKKSLPRIAGHREGINSVREITRACGEIGIGYLTLYTFSTENWSRPRNEVNALMKLLFTTINSEIKKLNEENVKFSIIGDLNDLPEQTLNGLQSGVNLTKENSGLVLTLALNYGSRQEIIDAIKLIAQKVKSGHLLPSQIDSELFSKCLHTKNMPDPDLLIRTSGEHRLSNFLLWQSAYAEIYMTDRFWPDFRKKDLIDAIINYQSRERRFGKVSSQLS